MDNQRSKIIAYCELKDLDLSEIVEDAGISAKNLQRPGVRKILNLARWRKVDDLEITKGVEIERGKGFETFGLGREVLC